MRLIVMTSSVIAYSCYLSCQEVAEQENSLVCEIEILSQSDTKMISFLIQEYAQMIAQGINSEEVHQLIQEKFQEKPDFGDKIWDKVQVLASLQQPESFYAFGGKK